MKKRQGLVLTDQLRKKAEKQLAAATGLPAMGFTDK
jgi:hypothetical protein